MSLEAILAQAKVAFANSPVTLSIIECVGASCATPYGAVELMEETMRRCQSEQGFNDAAADLIEYIESFGADLDEDC